MATHTFSRPIRVALGSLVAAVILSLLVLPAVDGPVAAKERQHHGQRQQAARDGHEGRLQSEARKAGKGKKRKKTKGRGTPQGTAPNGAQGLAGGLDTNRLLATYVSPLYTFACDYNLNPNQPYVNPQRCNNGPSAGGLGYAFAAQLEVFSDPSNCSTMRYEIYWLDTVGGEHYWRSDPVGPGGSTGVVDLGDGITFFRVDAIGLYGGCNYGTLASWNGYMKIITPNDLSTIL